MISCSYPLELDHTILTVKFHQDNIDGWIYWGIGSFFSFMQGTRRLALGFSYAINQILIAHSSLVHR